MECEAIMLRCVTFVVLGWVALARAVWAQDTVEVFWVQIEAKPNYEEALERIAIYELDLPDVNGFTLGSGWYGIALGPYTREDANLVLRSFRSAGRIPSDSYIAFGAAYQSQYWPENTDLLGIGTQAATLDIQTDSPAPEITTTDDTNTEAVAPADPDPETRADARRSESLLTRAEKQELQTALQWAGFYNSAIDGAFGRGTRNAMAAWQSANGLEATGVLTTLQRTLLLKRYNAPLEGLDLQLVRDEPAGIEVTLPTGLVAFDRYDPPFAHYTPKDGENARVLLISQQGDRATLASLFEVMQTLTVVPLEGPRSLSRDSFTLVGRDAQIVSETRVTLSNGEIKGFTLIWPAGDEERRTRVLAQMNASFAPLAGTLDPALGAGAPQSRDLLAGLDLRKPVQSRSGFFVDTAGAVITTASAVETCTRITLDDVYDATVTQLDSQNGLAILRPSETLAPPAVARFSPAPPRLDSEVAIAGYSYEGQLTAPSVTFGNLSDVTGLAGEPELNRLAVDALPGDEGGPVLDASGHVAGMLLPNVTGTRQLPDGVRFSLASDVITAALSQAGLRPSKGNGSDGLAPEDIAALGEEMTVLVSCWR